jgi:hypothetical protein
MAPPVAFFERGKGFRRAYPRTPFPISDEKLIELRLKYHGSTGRPRKDSGCPGGIAKIAKKLRVKPHVVKYRLSRLAERDE